MILTMKMQPVAAPLIPSVWADALKCLEKAIDMGGEYRPEDVYAALMEGRMVLWACQHAFSITSWQDFPLGRTAYVKWVGGANAKEWLPAAHEAWNRWAIDMGCTQLRMTGRRGWERLITDVEAAVMMRRRLPCISDAT